MVSCFFWLVWTLKRGKVVVERLVLWGSLRRLLIWDMGFGGFVGVILGSFILVCWFVGGVECGLEMLIYFLGLFCLVLGFGFC